MFKDDYRKEMENISANEKFKQDTISLMNQKKSELQQKETNTVKFRPALYRKIAATVAVAMLSLAVFAYSQSDFAIGPDSTETEKFTQQENEDITKDKDTYDNLPYDAAANGKMMRVYTVNDAVEINAIPQENQQKTKIYFNTQSTGGFGFEGYMYYSSSELEQNPTYSINDSFDTLPIYQFVSLSAEEIRKEVAMNCSKLGSGDTDLQFTWQRNIYDDDCYVKNCETAITFNSNIPSEEYYLSTVDGTLIQTYPERKELGKVSVWMPNSWYNVTLDRVISQSRDEMEIAKAVTAEYPGIFWGEDTTYGSWYDYTFTGNANTSVFAYKPSDDYGENIFNYSVNNIDIAQFAVSDEDSTWDETFIRLPLPCYSKMDDLPAINWQQALDQMYSGNYFTSSPKQITEDTVVNHIELVYLEPPYDIPTLSRKGYSIPFYRFFIDLGEEYQRQTDKGIMKTYGAYYVCAVHPDYVQLDDGYYRFN